MATVVLNLAEQWANRDRIHQTDAEIRPAAYIFSHLLLVMLRVTPVGLLLERITDTPHTTKYTKCSSI